MNEMRADFRMKCWECDSSTFIKILLKFAFFYTPSDCNFHLEIWSLAISAHTSLVLLYSSHNFGKRALHVA